MAWLERIRTIVTSRVYATHNQSPTIRATIEQAIELARKHREHPVIVNIGSGTTRVHPDALNVDIAPDKAVDCVASAYTLPFLSDSLDLVMSQEVIEHLEDPLAALREMHRVLKPGGYIYCQAPFVIGYHPGPNDYWRFTKEGLAQVLEHAGFAGARVSLAVGPGTGFYRIAVEFGALLVSALSRKLYLPAKGALAVALYPLKWFDPLLAKVAEVDRCAGGYLAIARKMDGENDPLA
jgi:SAM-dependent methyltransferase